MCTLPLLAGDKQGRRASAVAGQQASWSATSAWVLTVIGGGKPLHPQTRVVSVPSQNCTIFVGASEIQRLVIVRSIWDTPSDSARVPLFKASHSSTGCPGSVCWPVCTSSTLPREQGVHVFGPIHGGVFAAYVLIALLVRLAQRWSTPRCSSRRWRGSHSFAVVALRCGPSAPAGSRHATTRPRDSAQAGPPAAERPRSGPRCRTVVPCRAPLTDAPRSPSTTSSSS